MQNEKNENEKKLGDLVLPNHSYDGLFKAISKLTPDGIIKRHDCKFCNHPARSEAEAKYEASGRSNMNNIVKFLNDWNNAHPEAGLKPMNWINIRGHLLNHYLQQEKKKWLAEYGERITELMNYKVDKEQKFEMLASALELKFHEINSNPTLDPMKSADTLTKISKAIIEITITQAKMRGEMQTVNVFIDRFQNIWSHMVKSAKDPGVRTALLEGLETFQTNLESTVIPEIE